MNDKAKELLKEIFSKKEEKHSYPDEYSNIVRCMADYRYIKKKNKSSSTVSMVLETI